MVLCSFHFLFLEWRKLFSLWMTIFLSHKWGSQCWKWKSFESRAKRVIQSFSFFNTLFSPFVTQKTSHSQGKQFFFHSKKRKWNEQITFLDFPTTANNTFYTNLAEFQSKYGDNIFISIIIHQKLQLTEEKFIWEQGHGIIRNLC